MKKTGAARGIVPAPVPSAPDEILTEQEARAYGREMHEYLTGSLNIDPKKARQLVRDLVRVATAAEDTFVRI